MKTFVKGQKVWVKVWMRSPPAATGIWDSEWVSGIYHNLSDDPRNPHGVQLPAGYRRFCADEIMSEEEHTKMTLAL